MPPGVCIPSKHRCITTPSGDQGAVEYDKASPYQYIAMKFALATALLAGSAIAAPSSRERFARRLERRALSRGSQPKIPSSGLAALTTNETNVDYSSNWAGAVISKTSVSGVHCPDCTERDAERVSGDLDCRHRHVHSHDPQGSLW